jgi:hypothetical protein
MPTYVVADYFENGPGALVYAWAASRFDACPALNDPPPTGEPDAGPVVSGTAFGGPGAFQIVVPSVQDYYIQSVFEQTSYWKLVAKGSIAGQ